MAPISPLVVFAIGVLSAAMVVRHFVRERERARPDLKRANAAAEELKVGAIRKLRRDPATGVFRP